ncbi:MAG TPA: methyltransferase domain-containing protein [Gaiellaceae bacterium]
MPCCSSAAEYRRFFSVKQARRDARRYRRKGLDPAGRELVTLAGKGGLEGAVVLEVGAGVGDLSIELLRAGAASAVDVELSGCYEEEAAALLREAGLESRVERRLGDFVEEASRLEPADVVVLNRVVCCYPDAPRLLELASGLARRAVVLSYPRETAANRLLFRAINVSLRLRRCALHVYVHPMRRLLAESGLRVEPGPKAGLMWKTALLTK